MTAYARELGARLRDVRLQQNLSLHAVEQRSQGRWKAVVVGSYERGDRSVTVARLAELADFYGVPVRRLLPASDPSDAGTPQPVGRVVIDLERLSAAGAASGESAESADLAALRRFAATIQERRGDWNGRVLSLRHDDVAVLAALYDCPPEELVGRLIGWGVGTGPAVAGATAQQRAPGLATR
jgi:transcriptional regulator with XRE-family HTH domain